MANVDVRADDVCRVFKLPDVLREPNKAIELGRAYTANNVPVNLDCYGYSAKTVSDLVDELNIPAQYKEVIHGILGGVIGEHMQSARSAEGPTKFEWPEDSKDLPKNNYWTANAFHIVEEILHIVAQSLYDNTITQTGAPEANAHIGTQIIASLLTDFRKGPGPKEVLVHHMNAFDMITQEGLGDVLDRAGIDSKAIQRSVIGHQPFPPFIMSLLFRIMIEGQFNQRSEAALSSVSEKLGVSPERAKEMKDIVTERSVGVPSQAELSKQLNVARDEGHITHEELIELDTDSVKDSLLARYAQPEVDRRNSFYDKISHPQRHVVKGQDQIDLSENDLELMKMVDPRFELHQWTYPQPNDDLTWAVVRADSAQYPGSALIKLIPQRGPDTFAPDLLLVEDADGYGSTVGSILGNDPGKASFGACSEHMKPSQRSYYDNLRTTASQLVRIAVEEVKADPENAELLAKLRVPDSDREAAGADARYYYLNHPLPHDEKGAYVERDGKNSAIFDAAKELRAKVVEHIANLHDKALADGRYFNSKEYDVAVVRRRHTASRTYTEESIVKRAPSAPGRLGAEVDSPRRRSTVSDLGGALVYTGGRDSCPDLVGQFLGRESRLSQQSRLSQESRLSSFSETDV
jgi:hypothetical protein